MLPTADHDSIKFPLAKQSKRKTSQQTNGQSLYTHPLDTDIRKQIYAILGCCVT